MSDHLDGENIGLLHSAGYQNGGHVHGKDYSSFRIGDLGNSVAPVQKYSVEYFQQMFKKHATKQNLIIVSSVAVLVIATAMERVTFKIMVDRMLPYKFVLVQIIFLFSGFSFVGLTKAQPYLNSEYEDDMTDFPQSKIFTMAVVDTIPFLCMAFSASGVPPTMTIILMHSSTIFVVLGSKVIFPQRDYTKYNHIGIGLIAFSIAICLLKVMFWHMDLISAPSNQVALCCWGFFIATSLHGVSTLYKEKNIIEWSRPINNMYLSSCLFFYQFIVTVGIALVVNIILALSGYGEFDAIFTNIYEGWRCFLGFDSSQLHQDDMYVNCSESMGVVLGYVACNAIVVVSMSTVLRVGHQYLGRATEAAILGAYVVLWVYDVHVNHTTSLGGNEGIFDILAIIVLISGMEVYDRDPEPDVELITNRTAALAGAVTPSASLDETNNSSRDGLLTPL